MLRRPPRSGLSQMLRPAFLEITAPRRSALAPGMLNLASNVLVHPRLAPLHRELGLAVTAQGMQDYPHIALEHERFAEVVGIPAQRLLCAAGSDALLRLVYLALDPPGGFIQQAPCYGSWYGALARRAPQLWEVRADGSCDVGALAALLRARTPSVVVLSSPNSPLGPQLAHADLEALGDAAHAGDHLVVVDAAYEAFGTAWRPTGAMGDAFVWIRSLSKSFGLPGLRFGYLEARPALVAGLTHWNGAAEISAHAWRLAQAAHRHRAAFEGLWDDVRQWRAHFTKGLHAHGLDVLPSAANFVGANVGAERTARLVDALQRDGFATRQLSMFGRPETWRCTVAPPPVMDRILNAVGLCR